MAFVQQFQEQFFDSMGLIRAAVTGCPFSIGLVFIDNIPAAVLVNPESPGFLIVFPDKETHAVKRHPPLFTVFQQFFDRFRCPVFLSAIRTDLFILLNQLITERTMFSCCHERFSSV